MRRFLRTSLGRAALPSLFFSLFGAGSGAGCAPDLGGAEVAREGVRTAASGGGAPYRGAGRTVPPFGYGRVEQLLVYSPAAGRTGQWWCDNHFGRNLGGTWDCLRVGGARCGDDAPGGAAVTCGRYGRVDEGPFSPPACDAPALDGAEAEFCRYTEYRTTRAASTLYLYNDFVRAGFNRSFGGTLFELYGTDQQNRIEEHGGAAVQLSIWGYDAAASGAGYFTTETCSPTPFSDPARCAAANGGKACAFFPTRGAQISNCSTELACTGWSAGAPWNPIQAQAAGCGWNGTSNDVTAVAQGRDGLTLSKPEPYHFTKTTAFSGLTFHTTGQVPSDRPYVRLRYRMVYAGRDVGAHNQEIPAIFTDDRISAWYYFYEGAAPYADASGSVTRLAAGSGTGLNLPGRGTPPAGFETGAQAASEDWMSVCDASETQCLTVASFAPAVKTLVQSRHYVTALGRFALGRSFEKTWDVFLFPYRFDEVVAGRSVREWIYVLRRESLAAPAARLQPGARQHAAPADGAAGGRPGRPGRTGIANAACGRRSSRAQDPVKCRHEPTRTSRVRSGRVAVFRPRPRPQLRPRSRS